MIDAVMARRASGLQDGTGRCTSPNVCKRGARPVVPGLRCGAACRARYESSPIGGCDALVADVVFDGGVARCWREDASPRRVPQCWRVHAVRGCRSIATLPSLDGQKRHVNTLKLAAHPSPTHHQKHDSTTHQQKSPKYPSRLNLRTRSSHQSPSRPRHCCSRNCQSRNCPVHRPSPAPRNPYC